MQCLATGGKLFADSHDHDSIATALAAAVQAHQLEADFISVETFSAAVRLFAEGPPPSAAAVRPTPESLDAALTHPGTLNKIAGVADLFSELSASREDAKASRAEDRELANLLREVRAGVSVTSTLLLSTCCAVLCVQMDDQEFIRFDHVVIAAAAIGVVLERHWLGASRLARLPRHLLRANMRRYMDQETVMKLLDAAQRGSFVMPEVTAGVTVCVCECVCVCAYVCMYVCVYVCVCMCVICKCVNIYSFLVLAAGSACGRDQHCSQAQARPAQASAGNTTHAAQLAHS